MANNDYITTDCKLTVSKNTAKLDEEIFLYKNDRNIKLLIEIVDNKYRYKSDDLSNLLVKYKASYAQVKWYKNAEVKKEFPIQATDDGKVVFVIEGQLIDEDTELGDYDLQLRLLNESQESIRSLPIIKGAVHILKPLFEEGDIATVNSAVADVSMLSLDGDAIDTYNSDGTYNQTNWGNGDVISSAKLNKLEKVAKDNVDKVNKMPAKSIVEGGKLYLAKEDGTKLDSGTELPAGGSTIEVVNNLESDSTTAALSAAQGKVLNTQYKDIANIGTKEKLNGKFKSTTLEEILLEIYNKIYGTVSQPVNPLEVTIGNTIPRIDFTSDIWDTMKKDNPITVQSKLTFNNLVCNGYVELKWQGNSSLNYPKKNYTGKFYEDDTKSTKQKINIQLNTDSRKWGNENKFCFKANYIDKTHARNIVSARIGAKMLKTRSDYNNLPEKLKNAPNYGFIDGFPVEIYLNNEYLGLYTWNIPKDGWMFGMTEKDYSEIVICSEVPTDYCLFRAEPTHEHWSEEYPGDSIGTDGVLDKWKIAEAFVRTSDDATFTSQLSRHFNINSLLDYYIFCYLCCDIDGLGKNQVVCSYDGGNTWIYTLYDLDSTFGLYWNGSKLVSSTYRCPEDYETYATNKADGEYNLLFEKICRLFPSELYGRYRELRQGVLSNTNLISEFTAFKNHLPDEYYTRDGEKWTDIPSKDITSFEQIQTFINERCTYVDNMFETLFNKTSVDVTSITITGDTTTEVGNTIQLSAVVSPANASNKSVTWSSSNDDLATVNENGLVTTKTAGNVIITATSVSNSSIKATYTITISAKIEDKDRLVTEGLQSRWLFMEDSAREIDSTNQTLIFKDTVSNDNLKFPKSKTEVQDIAVVANNNSSLDGFRFDSLDSNNLGVIEDNTNVNKTEYTLEVCIKLVSEIKSTSTLITKFPQMPSKVYLYANGNLGGTIGNTWFEKKHNLSNHVNDDVVTISFKIMPTKVEVFIDGTSIGYSTANITTIDSPGSAILCGTNTGDYKFKEIRYYNRALTDKELTNNKLYTKDKYKTV